MMPRRVLVLTGDHSLPDPTKWDGHYTDDDLDLHRDMREALETLDGYAFEFLVEHDRLIERLTAAPPDLVLNFCDTGFRNVATQELHVPALLETLGIPYTGASPAGLVLCYDKHLVGLLAGELGVATPREVYVPPGEEPPARDIFFPALIKPAQGDGSVGIVPESLVRTPEEGRRYFAWMRRELPGRAALWQEYLPGPEYGLALVGNPETGLAPLPMLEVDYSELPDDLPPILAFESKTGPETRYTAVGLQPAGLPDATVAELQRGASRLFERLQCRDYARFDFRTGADGRVKLMEVNPNPAWSSAAKLAVMARHAGMSYADLLRTILDAAWARISGVSVADVGVGGA